MEKISEENLSDMLNHEISNAIITAEDVLKSIRLICEESNSSAPITISVVMLGIVHTLMANNSLNKEAIIRILKAQDDFNYKNNFNKNNDGAMDVLEKILTNVHVGFTHIQDDKINVLM